MYRQTKGIRAIMTMRTFTEAGRSCLDSGNLHGALALALMMPDICGSLVNPGINNSKDRYLDWFRAWAEQKFTSRARAGVEHPRFIVSAEDCYQIRNSFFHSGNAEIDPRKVRELGSFVFFDDTVRSHLNFVGKNTVDGVEMGGFLQLKARDFSAAIFDAVDEWEAATQDEVDIKERRAKLLIIHSSGATFLNGAVSFGG
jgi:hypothetical protein